MLAPAKEADMALHILKSDDGETIERTDAAIFEGGQV